MRFPMITAPRTIAYIFAFSIVAFAQPGTVFAQAGAHDTSDEVKVVGRRIARPTPNRAFTGVSFDGAVNILGFEDAKRNGGGRFTFDGETVAFMTDTATYEIPFTAVRSFTIEHSNKGLLRGTTGMMASYTPQGVGQVYSLFRPGAETLTLTYIDENRGLHGAILMLPKQRKNDVLRAFADAGLFPTGPEVADKPDEATVAYDTGHMSSRRERRSVEVAYPVTSARGVPAAFLVGAYEDTIAQMSKKGSFDVVYRYGDNRVDAHTLLLTTNITQLKKGNAGLRGAVPVIGMIAGKTQIEAEIALADADGRLLMKDSVKGSKRMVGENIDATKSLGQRINKSLAERLPEPDVRIPTTIARQ